MMDLSSEDIRHQIEDPTDNEIRNCIKSLENNIRIIQCEKSQAQHEICQLESQIGDSKKERRNNQKLPNLVSNVVEMLDINDPRVPKTSIITTSTRQTEGDALEKGRLTSRCSCRSRG